MPGSGAHVASIAPTVIWMGERLLVIGANAAGMAAAAEARRRAPSLEIVALEKGRWVSYSTCGIPFLAGGSVHKIEDLVVRTPADFRAVHIDVRTEHDVVGLDFDSRKVEVHNRVRGRSFQLGFDRLHLATGARARRPDLPGIELPHVHGVQTLDDAGDLLEDAEKRRPKRVVVLGSGYVGLELAEAFTERGAAVTVLEPGPEVMSSLDPDLGADVAKALRNLGIAVRVSAPAEEITGSSVRTPEGEVPADLVVLGTGVEPESRLGADAGLETGVHGSFVVDRQQRASAPGVWAAGDCCQSVHLVSGKAVSEPLGTVANKQGRVAGVNISGGYATFPGVLGTAVTRVCNLEIGRTGLNQTEALDAGFAAVSARVESTTTAGYMPGSADVSVKLTAERGSGRVLGMQIVGAKGSAKRVDVIAAALAGSLTAEDLTGLDLGYSPALSPLWDPIQVAARRLLPEL